ncbi:hypothetical protein C8R44DRAFT_974128 [Mycena epipterygia]|nr:hypothetical protein C8R44DRAFT_974128 [Mycena epipterygia]
MESLFRSASHVVKLLAARATRGWNLMAGSQKSKFYVLIYHDGVKIRGTAAVKGELAPKWDNTATM